MPLASLWKRKFIVSHVAVLAITCVLENLITDAVFFFGTKMLSLQFPSSPLGKEGHTSFPVTN